MYIYTVYYTIYIYTLYIYICIPTLPHITHLTELELRPKPSLPT